MSHQEHFFLEYMPAVFTSPKSTVIANTRGMPHLSKSHKHQALGLQMLQGTFGIVMAQETPGRRIPQIR